MMTRIKQWLQKLFSWWHGWEDPKPADAPVEHASRGISVDPMLRSSLDDTLPWQGVAPQMGSQGEPRRSTMENWRMPDPLIHPYSSVPDEDWDSQFPFPAPAPQIEPGRENMFPPPAGENSFSVRPIPPVPPVPPASTKSKSEPEVEQHLEFLRYLVRRGIVNEGFSEDQTPEQYRKNKEITG